MKKKIIFFDGDGTLWYPKKTKYKEGPWWIYKLPGGAKEHNKHLIMTPSALSTVKKLRKKGIILVILSTHPHQPRKADAIIEQKIKHFKLDGLFDEIHATRDYHGSKGEFMIEILKRRKIPKSKALMVGDSYNWDYRPARNNGVDCLLVQSEYMKKHPAAKRIKNTIKKLSDIFKHLS
jgi:FMN phosphatase YigB (HAD superfamily)